MMQKKKIQAAVLALSMAAVPLSTHAASLGTINVMSALGQPLRAEISVNATPQEMNSLTAKLASPEAFQQAGISLSNATPGLRIAVENTKRGAVVKVTSDRPINEPFVDILLEVSWGSGRIVREYTFLLDPPNFGTNAPKVAVDEHGKKIKTSPQENSPVLAESSNSSVNKSSKRRQRTVLHPSKTEQQSGDLYTTQSGDTLYKIAQEHTVEGANLDQVMLALFKNNKSAFIGNNPHRLRANASLSLPTEEQAQAVPSGKAYRQLMTRNFAEARNHIARNAQSVPGTSTDGAGAGGAVVNETATGSTVKNQVKISSAEGTRKSGTNKSSKSTTSTAAQEDLIANQRALTEAQARIKELESITQKHQELITIKNQQIADLERKKATQPNPTDVKPTVAPPAGTQQPPADVKPTVAPPAGTQQPPADVKPTVAPPAETQQPPADVKLTVAPPAETTPSADIKSPAENKPTKVRTPPPPPPPEPSFLEENLPVIGGGLAALVIAAGGLFYMRRRKQNQAALDDEDFEPSSDFPSEPTSEEGSVFGGEARGAREINTTTAAGDQSSSALTDFSQSGLTAFDTDEGVDPVAEADVYMAYGRDAQAEEILLDALKADNNRPAVHAKLLEIYQQRNDAKRFESKATELYALTQGVGPDWEKAAEIGRQFDPANPLFQKGMKEGTANSGKLDAVAPAAAATVAVSAVAAAEPILTTTVEEQAVNTSNNIDFSLGEDEGDLFVESTSFAESPQAEDSNLTFDTNFSNTQSGIKPLAEAPKVEETFESKSDEQAVEISFDLPSDVKVSSPAVDMPEISQAEDSTVEAGSLDSDDDDNVVDLTKTAFDGSLLDFDLDIETGESRAQSASSALDDLGFGESPAKNALKEEVEAEIGLETSFDHAGAETLAKGLSGEVEVASEAAPSDLDVPNEEVQTKLELAKAYKNMGEADDARELLQEILTEGSSSQKSEAKSLLASL